jgi:hypothetical protein
MMFRLLNFVVIGALVLAAAHVYRIKFNSTVQAERLAKLNSEVRHERDRIAALRAAWGQLDTPARIEALAKRYLHLKPIAPTQFDTLDNLPGRAPQELRADSKDLVGGLIGNFPAPDNVTGSIPASAGAPSGGPNEAPAPAAAASPPATPGAPNR